MSHPITRGPGNPFGVATPEVRRAGAALGDAVRAMHRIQPHDDLDGLRSGLPGSDSAAAAAALAEAWAESFGDWTTAGDLHADALRQGADDYDAVDAAVARAFGDQ